MHNTLVDLVCITHEQMWCINKDMGVMDVDNVRGRSVARRLTNVVGVDSVHGSIRLSKLWATTWATPVNSGMGTGGWTKISGFLDRQCLMGAL